ncbi:YihY/virulence factor BrkB family protein [Janthinobacterium sp. 17J80-10]|uniref:YihY/virulence factor BrkB family protein n=1 Tax=Janthinobacterium sp. 17J80-10 TaxID=2497863 RepID=UPI00100532BF|nr:YihY/virulence factor BrkB family protein [Janthinobacterium sp. 17J80-10]QAU34148.1 YihY/virulence factor BrkB family protein [Janthinobacterium sp. 17J80-10]
MRIHGFQDLDPFKVLASSIRHFIDDDMATYAAALAYHILFALFPFIMFLIALSGFFELTEMFEWLRQQAKSFLPPLAMDQVNRVINELQLPQKGLLSFGAITALWLASQGIRAIMAAMNVAYDTPESRPAWKLYPLSILYTTGIALLLLLAASLLIVGPQAMQWLAQLAGLEQLFVTLWAWLRLPAALLVLSLVIAFAYYAAPNVAHRFRMITPGSILAVVIWVAASLGFSYYVQNFGNYSVMYGSIGAVIVLLLYLYLSAAAFLFGAEVNAVIEREAGARRRLKSELSRAS